MPLGKKQDANGTIATLPLQQQPESAPATPAAESAASHGQRTMTKDDYWRRREERDIQRDKDMAWSGMAQAVLSSPYAGQFNLNSTADGYVDFVADITNKLLAKRPKT